MNNTAKLDKFANHTHLLNQRVYYEDTDFSGAIYHAAYLKFFERARTEWLRSLDIRQNELFEDGFAFMVSKLEIQFLSPAKMDEEVQIYTKVAKITPARIVFDQEITRKLTLADISEGKGKSIAHATVSVCAVLTAHNKFLPVRLVQVFLPKLI